MQHTGGAVVDLAAYKSKTKAVEPASQPDKQEDEILREIAHHLLMAIRAVKSLRH